MRIVIGADFVPTEANYDCFKRGDAEALVGSELLSIFRSADYRVFNLEIPLTDKETPMPKAGPPLIAPTYCINGYKALGIDLLGVANNHMLDQGYEGMKSTLDTLDGAGISYVGGGYSQQEAARPFYFEKDGKRVGIYACCEHEFSWARDYGFGANGFDPLETPDEIAAAKAECDYLIVLYHGGKEHYRYPSPTLRRVCRKIVEKGADLVLCQHTHCIGAEEEYRGGRILYGQGNFVFIKHWGEGDPFPGWWTGLLTVLDITDEGVKIDYVPYETTETGVALSHNPEIMEGFRQRTEEIKDERATEKQYAEFAAKLIPTRYVARMTGLPADAEFIARRGKAIFHYLECEAHYEALHVGLKHILGYPQFEGTLGKLEE